MTCRNTITITLDGLPCVVADRGHADDEARLANSYWCPLGPAPGRAWVLMLRRDLDAVLAKPSSYHELVLETRGDAPTVRLAFPKLLVEKSRRLLPGKSADPDALYLVELADKRILVDRFSDTGGLAFNVRSYAQAQSYLSESAGHTWASAVAVVWNTMSNVLGAFPGLPAGYAPDGQPENVRFTGVNAWHALNHLLAQIGCTVAYDPVADSFSIVRLGSTQPSVPDAWAGADTLLDADPLDTAASGFPATIRVYFHSHNQSYGQESDTEPSNNWSIVGHSASVDVPTNIAGAVPGTVLVLWDTLPRLLDEDNAPANSAALTARAAERAANWIADRQTSGERRLMVLARLVDVRPGAQVKAVLWRAWGPNRGGTATEIVTHPGLPVRVMGGSTALAGIAWHECEPAAESFLPPDLARHSYPNYPRLPNIVQVDDGSSPPGESVSPNGAGLFSGKVRRWVAGSLTTLESCWIRPVDLESGESPDPANVVSLRQLDCYLGRLSGVETFGGSTRPIYTVRAAHAASTIDLLALCANYIDWSLAERVDAASQLAVNKRASLRLWSRAPGEALVDLGGGPSNSLYWQGAGGGAPQWHTTPLVKKGIRLGDTGDGWVRFGAAFPAHLMGPRGSGNAYTIRLPENRPPGINSYIYTWELDDGQSCIQTRWGAQGITGVFYAAAVSGGTPNVVVTVSRGIVTYITGFVPPQGGDLGSVSCDTTPDAPFDPCG